MLVDPREVPVEIMYELARVPPRGSAASRRDRPSPAAITTTCTDSAVDKRDADNISAATLQWEQAKEDERQGDK